MTTTLLEPGTDATQDFTFFALTSGTVASATDQQHTGPRSLKCSTGAGPTTALAQTRDGVAADAGTRISWWFRSDGIGVGIHKILVLSTAGGGANAFDLRIAGSGNTKLSVATGATVTDGTTVLAVNTWYRITVAYTITSTTIWRIDVYINGVLEHSLSSLATLSSANTSCVKFRNDTTANINVWHDDIYVDNASSYGDPGTVAGGLQVTAKRPAANGTAVNFGVQIGAGGSGYGSGHTPQVNEQPLSVTNGWSVINAGSVITEEYNIEGVGTGDVNITGLTILDYMGWLYTKALAAETGSIVVNGAASNISITTAAALFTKAAGSATYPAGTGTDIGEVTDSTVTTVSLYEAGMIFAYLASTGTAITATTSGKSTDLADVTDAIPITEVAAGRSVDTATLTGSTSIVGAAAGASTDTAALTDAIPITAAVGAHSTDTADLTTPTVSITAAGPAASTDTAALTVAEPIAGTAAAGSTDTADMTVSAPSTATPAAGFRLTGIRDYSAWTPTDWSTKLPKTFTCIGVLMLPEAIIEAACRIVHNVAVGHIQGASFAPYSRVTRVWRPACEVEMRLRVRARVAHLAPLRRMLITHTTVATTTTNMDQVEEELAILGVL